MGLLNFFARKKALSASPEVLEAIRDRRADMGSLIAVGPAPYGGGQNVAVTAAVVQVQSNSYAWMYRTIPAVRIVIDFLARNLSQLELGLLERTGENEHHSRPDHPAMVTMRQPDAVTPAKLFQLNVFADFLLHHNTYILIMRPPGGVGDGTLTLKHIPSYRCGVIGRSFFEAEGYRIFRIDGSWFDVPPEDVIHFRGYNPLDPRVGVSPLETLRNALAEDAASQAANLELMKAGVAPPGYIARPLEAPDWGQEGGDRFAEYWRNQQAEPGRNTPVLEEGMEFKDYGYSPKDAEMLAGRRFTIEQVADIYGVPLGLLGINTGESLEEQQRQFYQDVLPPYVEQYTGTLDLGLLRNEYMEDNFYFTLNLDEKLQGVEQLKALVSAAGAPIILRNEGRAKLGLAPVEGGDELVTPLNVLVGNPAKPSPMVSPIQDPNAPSQEGDHRNGASANGAGAGASFGTSSDYTSIIEKHLSHDGGKGRKRRGSRKMPTLADKLYGEMLRHGGREDDPELRVIAKKQAQAINQAVREQNFDPDAAGEQITESLKRAAQREKVRQVLENPTLASLAQLPREVLWHYAGFTDEEIDRLMSMAHAQALLEQTSAQD